jgi:hypothetical protein
VSQPWEFASNCLLRSLLEGDGTERCAISERDRLEIEVHLGRDRAASSQAHPIWQLTGRDLKFSEKTGQNLLHQ